MKDVTLTAYAVIAPVAILPELDTVESTTLQFLKKGHSQSTISNILGFDIVRVVDSLADKGFINPDGKLKNFTVNRVHKQAYIFRVPGKNQFYDALLFFHETAPTRINLGKTCIADDRVLAAVCTLHSFETVCRVSAAPPIRTITETIL